MGKNQQIISLFLAALVTLTFSCQKMSTSHLNLKDVGGDGIFATRPQNLDVVLLTLKLKSNPIFSSESAALNKQSKKLSPLGQSRLKEIQAEQAQLEKNILAITAEAKVIYRLKYVVNALVVAVPADKVQAIQQLPAVAHLELSKSFGRPQPLPTSKFQAKDEPINLAKTSVNFIAADKAWAKGIRGQGLRVGVIDTGIDFTHSMLGGSGNADEFKNMDKSKPTSLFPNQVVVGGHDFVGTKFNAASALVSEQIPIADENPMDEGGHGTHVAGSIAGRGDKVHTYDGVAPDALLYSLKVFGENGSTSDAVVIAALDYAADPDSDGDLNDQLDVVNLSLGSGFGNPHILYSEAVKNLTAGGTVVVASAGNSGAVDYIVGSPSVSEEALSVAAGIDHSEHNYKFNAVRFSNSSAETFIAEAIESQASKPIAEVAEAKGVLFYAGLAKEDFSEEMKANLKGRVALIDRGVVNFSEKIRRAAEAGAIGVVVANNQPGEAFVMGGAGVVYTIPAIMVSLEVGDKLKKWMNLDLEKKTQDLNVIIDFKENEKILKPELIDRLTDFSSKGPRSFDSALKPEITAPGANIISADMGTGVKGVKLSGTSMSGPHVAGVMALLKQAYPHLSVKELKSIAMGTALSTGENGARYPLTRQGSGRVQVDKAIESILTSETSSVSLGAVGVGQKKTLLRSLSLRNLTSQDLELNVSFDGHENLSVDLPNTLRIPAYKSGPLKAKFTIDVTKLKNTEMELDGWIVLKQGQQVVYKIPVLAVAHSLSNIQFGDLVIHSTSVEDSIGALVSLPVRNPWSEGSIHLFNSLNSKSKFDDRKKFIDYFTSRDCDLQASGYRIIEKNGVEFIQFAAKTYRMNNTWDACEMSVLIDADQDGKVDQELVSQTWSVVPGSAPGAALLDYAKAVSLRKAYEEQLVTNRNTAKEDYSSALMGLGSLRAFDSSTVLMMDIELSKVAKDSMGNIHLQVVLSQAESRVVEEDDYLENSKQKFISISSFADEQGYTNLISVENVKDSTTLEFTKGGGNHELLILTPQNPFVMSQDGVDSQATQLNRATYAP